MLFDDFKRTDATPKRNVESSYDFLNRSSRPEISRVREFVESCVAEYPTSEIDDLISRLKSGDDTHFRSATFELLLYVALTRIGFKLLPHPELDNGSMAHPDFLVSSPDGEQFYLEAVLASEIKEINQGGEVIKGVVMDALASVHHHNFMIDVMDEGHPSTQPSGKKLTKAILNWLDSLDPDNIQHLIDTDGFGAVEFFDWSHEEWKLSFRPIPLKPERRGKAKTLIWGASGGVGQINSWTPLRDAVKYKGSKYGNLGLPFLVAVNVDTFALDPIDEMQALFGQEQFVISVDRPTNEPEMQRLPNGAWFGPKGPQYKRVSGAWFFNDLTPYTLATRRGTIYLNPWAPESFPESLLIMPHARASDGIMNWVDGMSLREVFGLDEQWPESSSLS